MKSINEEKKKLECSYPANTQRDGNIAQKLYLAYAGYNTLYQRCFKQLSYPLWTSYDAVMVIRSCWNFPTLHA